MNAQGPDDFSADKDSPYAPPRSEAQPVGSTPFRTEQGDATGGLIPYKNPAALLAYYLGLFSLFPCLGLFLAIPALVLGIIGLKRRRENPAIKGSVHAWIGIVMGGIFTVVWTIGWIGLIIAWLTGGMQQ